MYLATSIIIIAGKIIAVAIIVLYSTAVVTTTTAATATTTRVRNVSQREREPSASFPKVHGPPPPGRPNQLSGTGRPAVLHTPTPRVEPEGAGGSGNHSHASRKGCGHGTVRAGCSVVNNSGAREHA